MSELLLKRAGSLRIGRSFWFSANFSWPFARLEVYREKVVVVYMFFIGYCWLEGLGK